MVSNMPYANAKILTVQNYVSYFPISTKILKDL